MNLTKNDFNKICRMCLLTKKEMVTLQTSDTVEMIITCTGIEIKLNDGLPQMMCFDCSNEMHRFSAFRQRCRNSDAILHKIIIKQDNYDTSNEENDISVFSLNNTTELEHDFKKEVSDIDSNIKNETDSCESNQTQEPTLPVKKELEEVSETQELHKTENTLLECSESDVTDIKYKNLNSNNFINVLDKFENKQKKNVKNSENSSISKNDLKKGTKKDLKKGTKKDLKKGTKKEQSPKLKCDQCLKVFRKPCELAKHLNDIHKIKKTIECQVCSKTFHLQIQLDAHLKLHFKTKHICNICGREVADSSKLKRHQKIHKKREKIFCLYCDKSFISDEYFKTHVKLCHSGEAGIKEKKTCPMCGKIVVNIRMHIKQIHNQNRAYKCDQCDKSFIFNHLLTRHVEEKHLGLKKELKALCFICGKACTSQGELRRHLLIHDDNREFACNLCSKKYKSRDGLQWHLKKHKGIRSYACSLCSKKYFTKNQLQQHLYVHTGERPFACHICGHTFSYKSARWTHMKVHNVFNESNKLNKKTDANV